MIAVEGITPVFDSTWELLWEPSSAVTWAFVGSSSEDCRFDYRIYLTNRRHTSILIVLIIVLLPAIYLHIGMNVQLTNVTPLPLIIRRFNAAAKLENLIPMSTGDYLKVKVAINNRRRCWAGTTSSWMGAAAKVSWRVRESASRIVPSNNRFSRGFSVFGLFAH